MIGIQVCQRAESGGNKLTNSFFGSYFPSPSSAKTFTCFDTTGFKDFYSALEIKARSNTETFKTPYVAF